MVTGSYLNYADVVLYKYQCKNNLERKLLALKFGHFCQTRPQIRHAEEEKWELM